MRVPQTNHISPYLASLHWLPTNSRIQYKLVSLCYNCLNLAAPIYSTGLLKVYKPTRWLRSFFDTSILCLPSVCTPSVGRRSFSCAALSVWNSLPCNVRSSNSLTSFKSSFSSYPIDCVCVCMHVCACVCMRMCMCVCVLAEVCFDCGSVLCFVMGCVLQSGEIAHNRVHYYYYYPCQH